MPTDSISVYFTIKDDGSKVLASITDKTKSLDKETQRLTQSYTALQKANEPLIKAQIELEKELSKANKEAKEAEKAYKKLGDAASDEAWTEAKEKQQELHKALAETKTMIQENERAYKSNVETIRKGTNGILGTDSVSKLGVGLATSGVGQQASRAFGGLAQALFESGMGVPIASLASETISGVISGATLGSVIPGIGTAVGAIVGGVSGAISAGTQIFQAEDDAFKEYYKGLYEEVNAATAESISSGSTIAAGRQAHPAGDDVQHRRQRQSLCRDLREPGGPYLHRRVEQRAGQIGVVI